MSYINYLYGNIPNQFNQSQVQSNINTNNPISTTRVIQNQPSHFYPLLLQAQQLQANMNNQNIVYPQLMQMPNNNNNQPSTYPQQSIILVPNYQNQQNINCMNRSNTIRRSSFPSTIRTNSMQPQYIQQQPPQGVMYNYPNVVQPQPQHPKFSIIPNAFNYQASIMGNNLNRTPFAQNMRISTPIIQIPANRAVRRPLNDPAYPQAKRSPPCGNVNKMSILYMKTHIDPTSTADRETDEDYSHRQYYKVYFQHFTHFIRKLFSKQNRIEILRVYSLKKYEAEFYHLNMTK